MAARAYWTGHLRLSLVSFAVRIYSALEAYRTHMHQIHRPSGERIRYELTVPDIGEVSRDDIVKGYEYEKGQYVLFEPDELADLRIESKEVIDLVQFAPAGDIDMLYIDRPFFVVPDGAHALEPFAVFRDALRKSKKVGIGQITLSGRERIIAVRPCGKGMSMETLRYKEELKEANQYFDDIKDVQVGGEQVTMAEELIHKKTSHFDPEKFKDHYEEALRQAVEAKLKGKKPADITEDERHEAVIIDLTEALRRSLGKPEKKKKSEKGKTSTKQSTKKTTRKRAS